jgi:hypothetical protein
LCESSEYRFVPVKEEVLGRQEFVELLAIDGDLAIQEQVSSGLRP